MIAWFSGTGNSWQVAHMLSEATGNRLVRMVHPKRKDQTFPQEWPTEFGLVFPVYGWRLPKAVESFVEKLPPYPTTSNTYVYAVLTCGDDIGLTDRVLRKALKQKGWPLHAIFSVQMRNTYVCLPGFDTDSLATAGNKQAAFVERISRRIIPCIQRHQPSEPSDIHPGGFAWIKTYILGPLFDRFLTSPHPFRSSSSCTGCGMCAQSCPMGNISINADRRPQWGDRCTFCLACYHSCPHHAISYGPFTKEKGQVKVLRMDDKDTNV